MIKFVKAIFIIILLSSSYLPSERDLSRTDTTINRIQALIQTGKYVDAYLELNNYNSYNNSNESYITDWLRMKVLEKAYKDTNHTYYLEEYIKTLSKLCTYSLTKSSIMNANYSDPIWKATHKLTHYYRTIKDEAIKNIYETIQKNQLPTREIAFPVFYDYCNYLFERGFYYEGADALLTYLERLAKGERGSFLSAKALHLTALAQIMNVSDIEENSIYAANIKYQLDKATDIYKDIQSEDSYIQQLHLYGDYASYYFSIGKTKKAYKYLAKEKKGIIEKCGKDNIEYGWFLFHKGNLEWMAEQKEEAKQSFITAMNLFHKSGMSIKSSHRYVFMKNRYKQCLSFNEQETSKDLIYPLSYYLKRLKDLPSEFNSVNAKLLELTDIQLNLANFTPFPTQAYVRCLSLISDISTNNHDTNKEIVAIPNDYSYLIKQYHNKEGFSLQTLNKLMTGGHISTSKFSILGGIQELLQNRQFKKNTFSLLMDKYADLLLLEKNWNEALKSLQIAVSLQTKQDAGSVKGVERLSKIAHCYQRLNKIDSCRMKLTEVEKLLPRLESNKDNLQKLYITNAIISEIYLSLNDYTNCEIYADKVIDHKGNNFNVLPYYCAAVNKKAFSLFKEENFSLCARKLLSIRGITRQEKQDDNFYYLLISSLCKVHDARAIDVLKGYMEYATKEIIPLYFTQRSQFERDSLWSIKASNIIYLNMKVALTYPTPDMKKYAYNSIIYTKSLDSHFNSLLKESVRKGDSFVKRIYNQMISSQDSLNYGSIDNILWHKNNIAFAQTVLPFTMTKYALERLHTNDYFKAFQTISPHTAFVEFITYKDKNNSTYYAFITHRTDKTPKLVRIGTDKELAPLYDNTVRRIYQLYSNNNFLYNHIWEKIQGHLNPGIKNIAIIPSGVFNRINFNAIPTSYGMVADSFNIIRMTNLAFVKSKRKTKTRNQKFDMALFGNMKYDLTEEEIIQEAETQRLRPKVSYRGIHIMRGKLSPLPYASYELSRIEKTLQGSPLRIKTYTGKKATERNFKELSGCSPRIIHITTHGFYLKDNRAQHPFYNDTHFLNFRDHSLLFNGLLMAGAQHAWDGKSLPDNVEDGILTADEISRLDLSGTELVVLSACESALGDIDDTEGVLGLQRAFKRAGVRFVVMSLWPVRDDSSAYFMINFYKAIQTEKNMSIVMERAMKETARRFPNPADWAGFVLLR